MLKNYFHFNSWLGIANIWVLWFAPIYLATVFGAIVYINEQTGNFLAWFNILLLGIFDICYRLKNSKESIINALTFPAEGLILHIFIFPLPVWMASFIIVAIVFNH